MFANPQSLATLQAEWDGVVQMRERMNHLVITTFAYDPIASPAFGNILYNLPLLLAFDVLKHVLLQAKEEGLFPLSGRRLGDLMDSAQVSLPWIDWQCLREGVTSRNEVAHEGRLLGDKQCLQHIAEIEAQLAAWGVITETEPSPVNPLDLSPTNSNLKDVYK